MTPSSGSRETCDCCKDDMEFGKILEMKDVGVAIYRYLSQAQNVNQKGTANGQVFILQKTGGDDVKLEEVIAESVKTKIRCPRCMKTIEHVKSLLVELPPANIREVTGICEHCYQKEFLKCPCCENVVDKFVKFRMEETKQTKEEKERLKSWIIKTQLSLKKSFSNVKDSKVEPRTRPKGWIHAEADIEKELRVQIPLKESVSDTKVSKLEPRTRLDCRVQEYEIPASRMRPEREVLEKPLRVLSFLDFPEEVITPKPKKEKTGILKSRKDGPLGYVSKPYDKTKRSVSPVKQRSFETAMKSLSEPNISDFSYSFPHEKIVIKKQMEHQISSSELIKNTQDMLQEKEDAEKKKKAELKRLQDEKKRLADEEKRKREEEEALKQKLAKLEDVEEREEGEDRVKLTIRKKRDDIAASAALKEQLHQQAKEISEEEKRRKQNEKDLALRDTKARRAEKTIEDKEKQLAAEKIRKPTIVPDSEDKRKKNRGGKDQVDKSEKLDKKDKDREEKQYDVAATAALKDQVSKHAKEKFEEEKIRKRQERDIVLGEKKAKGAEKAMQLAAEKIKKPTIPDSEDGRKKDRGGKDQVYKSEKLDKKGKDREEKQHDVAATAALKDQVSNQAKEKLEEEKIRKRQERDMALGEKKAKDAEKAMQLAAEKIRKPTIPDSEDGRKKDRGGKAQVDKSEKLDKKDKDREEKQQNVAATAALKDQVSKQAKEKLEDEKIRKQQERDIAIIDKKAKVAEKAIEDKQKQLTTTEKVKKSPELKPDGTGDKGKGGEPKMAEKPAKEQKVKDDTLDDMLAVLKEQMAKQKQQELEKDKLRKEQQKEKELAEKRLKDLQTKNEEKAPVIKPLIILKHEVISDEEEVSEVMLKPEKVTDIIKGQKIYQVRSIKNAEEKHPILESKPAEEPQQKTDKEEPELPKQSAKQVKQTPEQKSAPKAVDPQYEPAAKDTYSKPATTSANKLKPPDPEATKGVIRYTLSDRTFIDKGWTMLPTEKVVRKMNVYRMRPAKPEFDWFEHNKYKREMAYDTGEKLAEFDDNGRGRWYYRTGELALDYYDAEETNAGQRFVIYSTEKPDKRGRSRPRTILATFDYSGNGIVFDHTGKIRLKYNQTEGVVLDQTIGPVSHWKWHTLNDPPVLQQVMIDTQMPYKDPTILKMGDKSADQKRPDNEEMIAIEFENFLKEKRQKLTQTFKPFQIKMKAMKINENFSFRVLDQASVYLLFRDGTTNLKINLGMLLDHKEIVDTDTAEIGEVSSTLDKLPACTDSIAGLQKAVTQAQVKDRLRVRHEQRLKRPEETASVDALRAGCSRPPRTPILQASLTSRDKMTPKRFKPSCCNLYNSTQQF